MAENSSKLGDMTKSSLDSIKAMLDANTIIGDPIQTPVGTTIIPISKITVGYASGGIDYAKKDAPQNSHNNNFGGGGGAGITVTPVAFLVVGADGKVDILNVNTPTQTGSADAVSSVVGFLERSPELIERIKSVFGRKNEENDI